MSAFTNAISTFDGFLGFTGDDPTTEAEYTAALAASDNNMIGRESWFSGDAPTWTEIQTRITEQADTTTGLPQVTAKKKLMDLGLTEEEIKNLVQATKA